LVKTLLVQTLKEWRAWLEKHHASEPEVWLVFHKQHTGIPSIEYKDALDEALCYGWVDSLIKRLDDDRFARKFTPRKPDSRWSDVNRRRYAELKAQGRLKRSGIARAPGAKGSAPKPARIELPATLPSYIQSALRKNSTARRNYEALSPAHQRRYFAWIASPKREETRQKRLEEAILMLRRGEQLGLK
jgi:uncharacterized protein YdeI (YjbR/CyaY-like superfamily)